MHNYYLIFFAAIFFSCGENTYENYHSFDHTGWNTDSIVVFKYNIYDTTKSYDLSLKIRHTIDYEFQNLFLFLIEDKNDTIEIMLSNKEGKWLGSGISDIREVEYVFCKKREFKRGEYKLRVEQAMRYGALNRIENLEHILDVGLIVSPKNE
jgi:gliding motility-associated lipoprotein GldH